MKKVVFYDGQDEEEQEFEDDSTIEEIDEVFNEWIAGRAGWYFKPIK